MSESEGARYCLDEVRRHDHDRYLAALFLRPDVRDDAFALLAFNVEIARTREIVSEPLLGQIRLQWWRDVLDEISRGERRAHPVVASLADAMGRHGLDRASLGAMIDAREVDLDDTPPPDLAALEAYARDTSGNLSALLMDIQGGGAAAREAALSIGTAWALVGLARAVAFHAQTQRLYIPDALLTAHEVERRRLLDLKPSAALNRAVAEIVARARELLAEARAASPGLSKAERRGLLLASLAERYIADMARVDFDPFAFPAEQPARALRLAWAAWRGRY
jgi:NADH dehydrogenase [ubiquinone] 1 alpha subcomplex assembly factor 6